MADRKEIACSDEDVSRRSQQRASALDGRVSAIEFIQDSLLRSLMRANPTLGSMCAEDLRERFAAASAEMHGDALAAFEDRVQAALLEAALYERSPEGVLSLWPRRRE